MSKVLDSGWLNCTKISSDQLEMKSVYQFHRTFLNTLLLRLISSTDSNLKVKSHTPTHVLLSHVIQHIYIRIHSYTTGSQGVNLRSNLVGNGQFLPLFLVCEHFSSLEWTAVETWRVITYASLLFTPGGGGGVGGGDKTGFFDILLHARLNF